MPITPMRSLHTAYRYQTLYPMNMHPSKIDINKKSPLRVIKYIPNPAWARSPRLAYSGWNKDEHVCQVPRLGFHRYARSGLGFSVCPLLDWPDVTELYKAVLRWALLIIIFMLKRPRLAVVTQYPQTARFFSFSFPSELLIPARSHS